MSDIVERLRSSAPLPLCPFERRSPEYYTTPNDKPCKFCGGLPEGPDKCTGADMRIMSEAADEIERLRALIGQENTNGGEVEAVAVPKSALDWLFGEGPDASGHWFGDGQHNPERRGAFWWRHAFRTMISDAALAHQPLSVPDGMQLVPVEPTPEMLGAWYRYKNGHHWPGEPPPRDTSDYGAYSAMLSAAPKPTEGEAE